MVTEVKIFFEYALGLWGVEILGGLVQNALAHKKFCFGLCPRCGQDPVVVGDRWGLCSACSAKIEIEGKKIEEEFGLEDTA